MSSEARISAARAFVRSVNVLLKSIRLYGLNHERATAQFGTAWEQLRAILSGAGESPVVLGVSDSQLLLDGVPLGDTSVERGFAELLSSAGLSSIQFTSRVTEEEFSRFVRAFAAAGPKPKALAEELRATLGGSREAAIRVNEVRFVAEDSALADARLSAHLAAGLLGINAEQVHAMLDDPEKLLQFIAAAEGTHAGVSPAAGEIPPTQAEIQPLREDEIATLTRLLTQLGQAGRQPGAPGVAREFQQQLARLPTTAKITLQQALAALAAAAPSPQQHTPMLLRLAEHLAIRYALDRYQRGEVEVNAVRELLDRMSREIRTLRELLGPDARLPEGADIRAESYSDLLDNQFWKSVPGEDRYSVLLSSEAWCVPPPNIRQAVERMLEEGDSETPTAVLLNYAACVQNPNPEARRKSARGVNALADLYARGYAEVIDAAIHHLCAQLARESLPELQKVLSDTFVHLNQEVAAVTSPLLGSLTLTCLTCGADRLSVPAREELVNRMGTQQLKLFCSKCQTVTSWSAVEPEPPSGPERAEVERPVSPAPGEPEQQGGRKQRRSGRVRVKLPIRVRSDAPELPFTEVSSIVNISRHGVLFHSSHALREGLEVFVLVPYSEGDALPETRGRVVRVQRLEDKYEVAVEFLR